MTHFKETGIAALLLTAVGFASPAAAAPLSVPSALGLTGTLVDSVAYGCGSCWTPNR